MHFIQITAPTKELRDAALTKALELDAKGEIKVLSIGRSDNCDSWNFYYLEMNPERPSFCPSGEFGNRARHGVTVVITSTAVMNAAFIS